MSAARHIRLFVLIDALGWRYVENRQFLPQLLPYRMPLRTVLGFSSGAIPSILTGLPPAQTGHWNLFYYDPQNSPFRWLRPFLFLPERLLENRITRKVLKEMGRRLLGLGPLFECCVSPRLLPWFNWVEKRNIYGPRGITGAPSIFDRLDEGGIPYRVYSYHEGTDQQLLERAQRDLRESNAGFFFVYLSEMDMFLHNHCNDALEVDKRLRWYEAQLAELFAAAKALDAEASWTVLSDHGMTPVRQHYDLVKEVDALGFSTPADYLAVYDSTMARFWFFSDRARKQITERLNTVPCGQVLSDEQLRQFGVFFPDRRYGEVVLLLHPGWLLARSDFNGAGWRPAGMHGYHPDDPDSDAIFLSNRPPRLAMRTIADVYQCMQEATA